MMAKRREFLAFFGLAGTAWLVPGFRSRGTRTIVKEEQPMAYVANDYSKLIGMDGFSETLLKNHFTLYQGYVTNTNKVLDTLGQMVGRQAGTPAFAELKRRSAGSGTACGSTSTTSGT